ncbi:MAG: NnrS family protein [Acidobacteria bacterium]|nr:NnrS family protein [Acidobacteriota bacterium]
MDSQPDSDKLIYRRFFVAGIVSVLTVGAGWGVWLLITIATRQSLTAPSVFSVNAHGQAQIYGWVGLFILGSAYQVFPRFKRTELRLVPLAHASFFLMAGGIVVRSVAEPLGSSPMAWMAVAGALLQALAVLFFAAVIVVTAVRAGPLEVHDWYILAAIAWFFAAASLDVFHVHEMVTATSRQALLHQVATYQFALRNIQIQGVAMMMIFGVSLRLFPAILGTPRPSLIVARLLWLPLNLALVAQAAGFVGFMSTRDLLFASVMASGSLFVAILAIGYAANLRTLSRRARPVRSLKFLRAAQIWLAVSQVMLVGAPVYFRLSGLGFSHAWYGAMRHAITVGFVSLTIMGVAAAVVPALEGTDPIHLNRLWAPFLLVNTGCLLRVTSQIATDFVPSAFPVAAVSGVLELTGLGIWGAGIVRLMLRDGRLSLGEKGILSFVQPPDPRGSPDE